MRFCPMPKLFAQVMMRQARVCAECENQPLERKIEILRTLVLPADDQLRDRMKQFVVTFHDNTHPQALSGRPMLHRYS